ncbi:hypothetical protein [Kribbella sp. CA-293567]|uniref:hypothetical protein n=1 Tax=Kribbella sp. CA-293567 TaxID=3002436 RepID=UPI0022DD6CF9|nr:hypothetical protein [Kribbella sp. CA-293567]WBQ03297.1 hypothetical protein OX958_25365 [Kribbella sp. CA-293567]
MTLSPQPSVSLVPRRPSASAVAWPSSTPSLTPSVRASARAPAQREQPAEAPASVVVQDSSSPPSPPKLPAPTAGGVQVEGVALARSTASGKSLGVLGGIFLASGGVLLAAVAFLNLKRRGKHSV